MVTSIYIRNMNMDYFSSKYRFSFTDKTDHPAITDAVYQPSASDSGTFSNMSLDDFNKRMLDIEQGKNKSAVALDFKDQPKDVREILSKIANGKYKNLINRYADKVVLGRNFEKLAVTGNFQEDLGATAAEDVATTLGSEAKHQVYIDSYNSVFNSLASKTKGDKLFTKFSQILSVVSNEVKQAYNVSRGKVVEDSKVYEQLQGLFTDLTNYMDNGGTFKFLKSSEKTIFNQAVTMMSDNIDAYLKKQGSNGNVSIKFTGIA